MSPLYCGLVGFVVGVVFTLGVQCVAGLVDQMFVVDEDGGV